MGENAENSVKLRNSELFAGRSDISRYPRVYPVLGGRLGESAGAGSDDRNAPLIAARDGRRCDDGANGADPDNAAHFFSKFPKKEAGIRETDSVCITGLLQSSIP